MTGKITTAIYEIIQKIFGTVSWIKHPPLCPPAVCMGILLDITTQLVH